MADRYLIKFAVFISFEIISISDVGNNTYQIKKRKGEI